MVLQRLLSRFYDHVESLPEFLERILPDRAKHHVQQIFDDDEPTTSSFADALQRLKNSLVCTTSTVHFEEQLWNNWKPPGSQEASKEGSLSELLHFAQRRLLRSGAGLRHASNMLTLGYREADDRLAGTREVRMAGSYAVTNFYVNPFVSMIMLGKEWQHLFDRLGSMVMLHLLTRTSIFLPVSEGEGNMTQIIGPSLADVQPMQEKEVSSMPIQSRTAGRKRKRKHHHTIEANKTSNTVKSQPMLALPRSKTMASRSKSDSVIGPLRTGKANTNPIVKLVPLIRKPSEIQLSRNKIFYARPLKTRSGHVALGLPTMHVFNRTVPKTSKYKQGESKKVMSIKEINTTERSKGDLKERCRKVVKYIWPRQYGLSNVFTSKERKCQGIALAQDYANREDRIKALGSIRTPQRLQTASRLVAIMLSKHDRLDYPKLLQYCCSSSLRSKRLTRAEREDIISNLSETSTREINTSNASQLQTQPGIGDAIGSFAPSQYLRQSGTVPVQKPAFTKYKVATGSVSRFAQAVIRHIVPFELLGSHYNLRLVLKNINTFVRLRRHETLNLHHLCQGLRILDCDWLLPRNKRALKQRATAAEMLKRQNLLYELIYYLFDSIIIPLLRTNFYATESVAFRNRTVYFRQDDWNSITLPILEKLKAGYFTTLSKNEAISIMSGRDFGYSYVRLLPKLNGVRPIVNLRRRSVKIDRNQSESQQMVQQQQSINTILNITFHVLNYEKKSDLGRLGSSVFGSQDVYERLYNYKSTLLTSNKGNLPRLYFVKVDVACAFDSIDQDRLLEIVQDIVSHDRYVIQKFCQIMAKGDRISKSWPRIACAEEEAESTLKAVEDHAKDLNNVLLCDGVVYTHCERSRLIWLLEEHINNNLIKVGKVFCKQRVGIPQGSTLSTLLCCYYLAKMEAEKGLHSHHDRGSTLLMRYTDDYLYISTSEESTRQFYETMKAGDESFNVKIAMEKSLHNLDMSIADENTRLPSDHRLFPWCSYLINTEDLSVQYDVTRYDHSNLADTLTINQKKPMQNLNRVLQSSIRNQNLCIFLDVELNGIKIVIGNLYRNFLLAALKFITCYREIRRIHGIKRNDAYITSCINASIGLCYAGIQAKMKKSLRNGSNWEINRSTFHFLALHAFARIFSLRSSCHKWVSPLHRQIKSSHQYQLAYRNNIQHITEAWQSCKGIIASIKV